MGLPGGYVIETKQDLGPLNVDDGSGHNLSNMSSTLQTMDNCKHNVHIMNQPQSHTLRETEYDKQLRYLNYIIFRFADK